MNYKSIIAKIKPKALQIWSFLKKHPFKSLGYASALVVSFVILLFVITYFGAFGRIPKENELKNLKNPLTSTIYGSDGKAIGNYFLQNRSNIDSTQLNPYLINALTSTEDVRFYSHHGIDYKSYARVIIKSILLQKSTGGGSTITQQIAKNLFGRKKQYILSTPINKMREVIIANRLENIYSKEDLILLYFNTVSFGENIYGIEKAAMRFFSKTPKELTLAESATLIGLLKAPTYYNPRKNKNRAEQRRNTVMQQMLKYNYITKTDYETAKNPLVLKYQPPEKTSSLTSYYKEYVKAEFDKWAIANPAKGRYIYDLDKDGLNVYTSINPYVQKYIEKAMIRQIERLQDMMDKNWNSVTTTGGKDSLVKKLVESHRQVKTLLKQGKTKQEIAQFIHQKKPRKYWEIDKGYILTSQSLQDSIVNAITRLHTGIIVMNSHNGKIMGYLGGIDYGFSQTDNTQSRKQVGSTFKPITYLAALENGSDPCDYYDNFLRTYTEFENWKPKNANNTYGGSYSLQGALAHSVNTVSVSVQLKTGMNKVINLARKMGIISDIPQVPSIVLGTADISLIEMATAYASISNGGTAVTPYTIEKIENHDGTILYEAKSTYKGRVASKQNVTKLQKMMEGVLTEGTGAGFKNYEIPFTIIGKTGTTQNNGDGWFIGCSPEIVVAAWVGTQDKRVHFANTYMGSGANTAMPIVASVFKSLSSWKKPILSNFEYDIPYFPCPALSDLPAQEAYAFYKNDTTYIQQLKIKDSLLSIKNVEMDSIVIDSIKTIKDSIVSVPNN
ncbi:transglycosylase domain-containing protein [Aquimarina muelleri]|uniref:Penicillin-binding protein 1A n=1 Tax=Aquimarina muelleri TaxID=279356 RepID=A0A918N5K5_9FLAO|nr:transglycosylase domain-containing protein [Aquimarina muelleri]MCX2763659.1 transglycosylase domain-containing protein [Aquimarina muelleri]GGX30113.1 penicillin-binding protein 1A [Aquimarina muelleri]